MHAQSVCTRPFLLLPSKGPGDEANTTLAHMHTHIYIKIMYRKRSLECIGRRAKEERRYNLEMSHFDAKVYDCQFGVKYYKKKTVQGKRLWLQGSRKIGCKAHVEVKSFALYPEYAVSDAEKEGLSKWKLRCLYEEKMKQLKTDLASNKIVKVELKHFVSLPCE